MASSGRMRCLPLSFYNIHNFTSVLLDTSIGKGLERMNARLMIKALWFIYSEDTSTGRCINDGSPHDLSPVPTSAFL